MNPDHSIRFLRDFGLDILLTEEDDPNLWAMVLIRNWPPADELRQWCAEPKGPDNLVPITIGSEIFEVPQALYIFGVFKMIVQNGELTCPPTREECYRKEWRLVSHAGRFKARDIFSKDCFERSLHVSRPSKGVDVARVHAAWHNGVLAGQGVDAIWRRANNGFWAEESASPWIS